MLRRIGFILPLSVALVVAFAVSALAGENPLKIISILVNGSFGSATGIGYTFYYATPLIFTGLSVAWALRAGLFNIGAEGQMTLAGVALASIGQLSLSRPISFILAIFVVFVTGGLWASLAGYLKAKRNVHEVLATILLNFIAYGLASFLINVTLQDTQLLTSATQPMSEGFHLPMLDFFGGGSPLNVSFLIAIFVAALYGFFDLKSLVGFRQRLVGEAQGLARQTGINVSGQVVMAMMLSGGLAGLASINEILGYSHKTKEGFASGAGFVGIAVALMGRGKWYGIVLASILFGAIHKGSLDLDIDTEKMSRDFASVLQGLIILFVCAESGISRLIAGRKNA